MAPPHFGFTNEHGLPVHLHVLDYHAAENAYGKANRKIATWITQHVGTMTCFWFFTVLALLSLPATLKEADIHLNALYTVIPAFFLTFGFIYLITWICQNYIQLVLLPALMVGQNLQNEASDARNAKQFEDTEQLREDMKIALDRLDEHTTGGIKTILDRLDAWPDPGLLKK